MRCRVFPALLAVAVVAVAVLCRPDLARAQSAASPRPGTPPLHTTADLHDKRIGVQLGTVYDIYAAKTFPKATVVQFSTYQEVTLAVSAGKVDAGLSDIDTLNEVRRANADLVPFGDPIFSSDVAAGFRKTDGPLRASFNTFLAQLRADGTYASMVERWMTMRQTAMPPLPSGKTAGTLTIGVSSGGFPFAAVQDGALAGFDIELAQRFGRAIGKDVRLIDQEFGGLIAALSSGKIDVIVADMFVTPERQQQINFSEPYFAQDSVAFTTRANLQPRAPTGTAASAPAPAQPGFLARVASSFRSNILVEQRYLLIWAGLQTTVFISVLSTVLGTGIGAVVCFMRMSGRAVLEWPARTYIAILRGTPIVVLLMLLFYVVFGSVDIDPVAVAILAFGMNFGAYVSEMFRSGIESIDRGQTEAGLAMGFTPVQTFTTIVLPQMVQRVLPVYRGEFISLVKMTSVVGYIAVQDLTKASDIIRSRTFDAFFPLVMVAVLYFVVAFVLMQALEYLERRTDRRRSRRVGVAR